MSEIRSYFEELVRKLSDESKICDIQYKFSDPLKMVFPEYNVQYRYGGYTINISNEFGTCDLGFVETKIKSFNNKFNFEIKTKSLIKQFFNTKASPLIIITDNKIFIDYISSKASYIALCSRARKDQFEPLITGELKEGVYSIKCRYHLVFNNQELVIEPLCQLFNDMVDFFKDN